MNLINLTPHAITIDGVGTILPAPVAARVDVHTLTHTAGGMPCRVRAQGFGAVTGLPDPVEGVAYVVSAIVLARVKAQFGQYARFDVFAPDTGPDAIRNENGQIVAVQGLVC